MDKDEKYYSELIEHLTKAKRWEEVIEYSEKAIAKIKKDQPSWPTLHYYSNYNEWARDAYRELGKFQKAFEYQMGIYYHKPNTGKSLKLYAETMEYAKKVGKENDFKNEVLKSYQKSDEIDDKINLAQVLLYEGDYGAAFKIAKEFDLEYSGTTYNPVLVSAYFFTYAVFCNESNQKNKKNIEVLFNKMRKENYANTPYSPLMDSIKGKTFSSTERTKFSDWAILCYKNMFNFIVQNKIRTDYYEAANHCAIMKEIYEYHGKLAEFNRYYSGILEKYHRYRSLKSELKKLEL